MVGNETFIGVYAQIMQLIQGTNVGDMTNQVMLAFGGLASVTIIYFLLMLYIQSQINRKLKEQRNDIDLLIMLLNEQNKKLDAIHKVLIVVDEK